MNSYFLPQNVQGIGSYQADGGESGWFQLDVPGANLDVFPFAVPEGSTGILVQAIDADVLYCLSPVEALAGTSAYLTLPAGSTIFLPGQASVRQFCVLFNGDTPNLVVQFYNGDIGPTPMVNIPGSGGGPPGSGTVTSVNVSGGTTGLGATGGPITGAGVITLTGRARVDTDNAVHVMANGDDATGLRGRLDKPFATFAAAYAASLVADAIVVWPGSFPVVDQDLANRSVVLIGSEIYADVGSSFLFKCSGIVSITGDGYTGLRSPNAGTETVIVAKETCSVSINVAFLISVGSIGKASAEGTTINVVSPVIESGEIAFTGWESATIRGNITSQLNAYQVNSGCALIHYGDIEARDLGIDIYDGEATIYGNVRAFSNNGEGVIRTNGVAKLKVYGDIIATGTGMVGVNVDNGNAQIDIYGNIQALQLAGIYAQTTDPGSTISVHGDIECLARHGILTHTADITVWGNITTGGLITDANAVHAIGPSTVRVYGHCSSVAGAAAKTSNVGALIELFGNAHSTGRWGIFCISGGHIICHGIASSDFREGAYCEVGQLTILGGARSANDTAPVIMLTQEVVAGNLVTLGGAAYLQGTAGTLYAVDCNPGGIIGLRTYGAYGNKPVNPSLTLVGTYTQVP